MDGAIMDITGQRAIERRHELLLYELQHRVKNVMTVIQSIAMLTFKGAGTMEEARSIFVRRLTALARAHTTLVHHASAGALLDEVIHEELSAFSDQAQVSGCDILLKPDVAQSFALLVHELATNAVKYGALSTPEGIVTIRGEIGQTANDTRFHFSWAEQGGPAVTAPAAFTGPQHASFGRNLLGTVSESLGRAEWAFDPQGLRFELVSDMATIAAPPDASEDAPAAFGGGSDGLRKASGRRG